MIMFHVSLPGCILDQIALLVDDFGIFFDLEETFGPILSIFRVKGTGEEADREALVGGWWLVVLAPANSLSRKQNIFMFYCRYSISQFPGCIVFISDTRMIRYIYI